MAHQRHLDRLAVFRYAVDRCARSRTTLSVLLDPLYFRVAGSVALCALRKVVICRECMTSSTKSSTQHGGCSCTRVSLARTGTRILCFSNVPPSPLPPPARPLSISLSASPSFSPSLSASIYISVCLFLSLSVSFCRSRSLCRGPCLSLSCPLFLSPPPRSICGTFLQIARQMGWCAFSRYLQVLG